jgi:hypothetical protein
MKSLLVLVILTSLTLTGCCTRQRLDDFSRFEGSANQPSGLCGIFSGFGTMEEPDRFSAVYSPVGVHEYGDLLCGHLEVEDYASCVNRVWDHYRRSQREGAEPGDSTSGPFAMSLYDDVLLGDYWSDPFSGSFRVSGDRLSCRGSYNALFGSESSAFDVSCDNGRRGRAAMVRDRSGRNGIGRIYMDDGEQGSIVFGHDIVGGVLQSSGS